MNEKARPAKIPRSLRKHLRQRKARLRRELPPEKAKREIDKLVRELRH